MLLIAMKYTNYEFKISYANVCKIVFTTNSFWFITNYSFSLEHSFWKCMVL